MISLSLQNESTPCSNYPIHTQIRGTETIWPNGQATIAPYRSLRVKDDALGIKMKFADPAVNSSRLWTRFGTTLTRVKLLPHKNI